MSVCIIPDCGAPSSTRHMCHRCYVRELHRALRGAPSAIDADTIKPRRPIADMAADDITEYEHLLHGGCDHTDALARIGLSGRSMARRYQRLGRPVPAGLWTAAEQKKRGHA